MPAEEPSIPASSDRPLPLSRRLDLKMERVVLRGVASWTVKDSVTLDYYRLTVEQHALLLLLDGSRSVKQLRAALVQAVPDCRPSVDEVRRLAFDLFDKGLAYSTRPGQADALADRDRKRRRKRLFAAALSLMFVRLPGVHPKRLLDALLPWAEWAMTRPALRAGAAAVVGAWVSLIVNAGAVTQQLPNAAEFATPRMLLLLWATMGIAKILHELGHALACRRLGGECQEIGLALLLFCPCLYCDVSDAALFRERWKRLAVGAAGVGVELLLSAAAVGAWWLLEPGLMRDACVCLFLATNVSAIAFNLNPLLRLDGYYLVSDWLETPNLRRRADRALGGVVARRLLGVAPADADPHGDRLRPALLAYAVASACYRWSFLAIVTLSLWAMLRPWGLGAVGLAIGGATAAASLTQSGIRFSRFVASRSVALRDSTRARLMAGAATALLGGFFLLPIPLPVEARLVVEPGGLQHVYVTTPGRVASVHARPSQWVEAGQVIAVLENPARRDRYLRRRTAVLAQQVEVARHHAAGDAAAHAVAVESLKRTHRRASADYEQLKELTITAPCAGRLLEPPATPPPARDGAVRLATWHGRPLDAANRGATLAHGVHVASIAPGLDDSTPGGSAPAWRAVLWIDQHDRGDFAEGAPVRLRVDGLTGRVWRGRVEQVTNWVDHPSVTGATAGATTASLAEQHRYRAHVAMTGPPAALAQGMTGRARVTVTDRTAAAWLWRWLRLTFNRPA